MNRFSLFSFHCCMVLFCEPHLITLCFTFTSNNKVPLLPISTLRKVKDTCLPESYTSSHTFSLHYKRNLPPSHPPTIPTSESPFYSCPSFWGNRSSKLVSRWSFPPTSPPTVPGSDTHYGEYVMFCVTCPVLCAARLSLSPPDGGSEHLQTERLLPGGHAAPFLCAQPAPRRNQYFHPYSRSSVKRQRHSGAREWVSDVPPLPLFTGCTARHACMSLLGCVCVCDTGPCEATLVSAEILLAALSLSVSFSYVCLWTQAQTSFRLFCRAWNSVSLLDTTQPDVGMLGSVGCTTIR